MSYVREVYEVTWHLRVLIKEDVELLLGSKESCLVSLLSPNRLDYFLYE